MKTKFYSLFIALALRASVHQVAAQGTAFTYRGRLNNDPKAMTDLSEGKGMVLVLATLQ